MTERDQRFHQTATTYRQGSLTLAREYYTAPAILEEEIERIFATQWNCVGRASRVSQPEEWFLATVAGDSLIVLRDRQGVLRAFFNVCRHRGTRLCEAPSGRFSETSGKAFSSSTWRSSRSHLLF